MNLPEQGMGKYTVLPSDGARPSAETFALCLLLALALQIADSLLPKIPLFPWLRLGLSHIVMLPFAIRFGWRYGFGLFLCRNVLALFYGGQILSAFLISTSAGFLTYLLVTSWGVVLYRKNILGLLGLSVIVAGAFNLLQLLAVQFLLIRHTDFFFQTGPLLIWSVISGALMAWGIQVTAPVVSGLMNSENENLKEENFGKKGSGEGKGKSREGGPQPSPKEDVFESKGRFAWGLLSYPVILLLILAIPNIWFQLVACALTGYMAGTRAKGPLLLAWPFYFYLAWFYLLQREGVFIVGDWVTQEGWENFRYYALRTTGILLTGVAFSRALKKYPLRVKGNGAVAQGLLLSLPLMPALFGLAVKGAGEIWRGLKGGKGAQALEPLVESLRRELRGTGQGT